MIISASRRTDIPNYYSEWFFNRIKEGFFLVRNPFNYHQVSRISVNRDNVGCIVFLTKNPEPMLERLDELQDYHYYFQYTLTPYGADIEPNVPDKRTVAETFKKLADMIGPKRVVWRYDPILINAVYTVDYHEEYFDKLAWQLQGYTEKCTISFVDIYKNTKKNQASLGLIPFDDEVRCDIAGRLSSIAYSYGLKMDTCCEDIDLSSMGIFNARCIDDRLIDEITGNSLNLQKAKGQRKACGCVQSVDIGVYNTCPNGCKYCYANYSSGAISRNFSSHDKASPFMCGVLTEKDKVTER